VETLTVVHLDEALVAVHKPPGLLVHRTALDSKAEDFLLQRLRRQLGQRVYTVHRLDRPTSGVLVFGLTPAHARTLSASFEQRRVEKRYLAVVRGYLEKTGCVDYPLQDEPEQPLREAVTDYRCLARVELPVAVSRYPTSRYSLALVLPRTGRYHQIRRHFHHIHHPLIGDTTHGEGRHNRLFRKRFGVHRLLLHAVALGFPHPDTDAWINVTAPPDRQWRTLMRTLDWPGDDPASIPS